MVEANFWRVSRLGFVWWAIILAYALWLDPRTASCASYIVQCIDDNHASNMPLVTKGSSVAANNELSMLALILSAVRQVFS